MIASLLLAAAWSWQAVPAPAQPAPLPVAQAEIVATYPHDPRAFTEGLLIDRGTLYESTGREGQSDIRRVDLKTGRVLASVKLAPQLFGEGIVAWRNQLLSVTWHGGQGFKWSLPGLKRTGGFRYTGEGWAMTDDGRNIILSDGTPVLRFLDPSTQKVVRRLTVTANGRPVQQLNELEYIDGQIYANIWMTPYIARIDPANGRVVGVIDVSPLIAKVALADRDSVPNGIAYDRVAHRLYVTGKNWPSLFEIKRPR